MKSRPILLATGSGYTAEQFARLSERGYSVTHVSTLDKQTLDVILPSVEVYVLGGEEVLGPTEFDMANSLKLVSFVGTGFGAFVDASSAAKMGVPILTTVGVNTAAMTEYTIGMILAMTRGLFELNDIAKGRCSSVVTLNELSSQVVGIVGMGAVGSALARSLVLSFGCRVVYTSRTRKPQLEHDLGITWSSLVDLLPAVDVLVLLLPTSPSTVGLFDDAMLAHMRHGTILVNPAGAGLVDPSALRRSLDSGRLAAAAFDGYWCEPLPSLRDDVWGLLSYPDRQFVVTPHVAGRTSKSWTRMVSAAVDNVLNYAEADKHLQEPAK